MPEVFQGGCLDDPYEIATLPKMVRALAGANV
jgi:hypothetical protein